MATFKATLSSGKEIIVNAIDMVYAVSELNQKGHRYDVAKIERWASADRKREQEKKTQEKKEQERHENECTA